MEASVCLMPRGLAGSFHQPEVAIVVPSLRWTYSGTVQVVARPAAYALFDETRRKQIPGHHRQDGERNFCDPILLAYIFTFILPIKISRYKHPTWSVQKRYPWLNVVCGRCSIEA